MQFKLDFIVVRQCMLDLRFFIVVKATMFCMTKSTSPAGLQVVFWSGETDSVDGVAHSRHNRKQWRDAEVLSRRVDFSHLPCLVRLCRAIYRYIHDDSQGVLYQRAQT